MRTASLNQAPILPHRELRLRLRARMDATQLNYTKVARRVRHDLAVVSKSINHGRYPRVLAKVRRLLDV